MAKIVSVKAELTVLRGLCNPNRAVSGSIIASTDESYFFNEQSIEIYKAIISKTKESGNPPSFKSIIDDPEISKDAREFFRQSSADIQTKDDVKRQVDILNKYRQLRCLYQMCSVTAKELESDKVGIDALIDKASDLLNQARSSKKVDIETLRFGKGNNSSSLVQDILFGENKDDLIPTGYKTFDDINGGFPRGGLVTIGGSTGAGKSIMAVDLSIKLANMGYRVVIVPLEMTQRELTTRMIANVTGIDALLISQNHKMTPQEKESANKRMTAWMKKVAKIGGAVYIYEPDRDITIDEIYAEIACYDPDVCIIDYISLLAGADSEDQWRQLGKIARTAKINAKNSNRVNILLCQVDQEGKVRYSRAISEHSNSSWVFVATQETKEAGILKIDQQKARSGRAFPFTLKISYDKMRISDMPSDQVDVEIGTIPEPVKSSLTSDL